MKEGLVSVAPEAGVAAPRQDRRQELIALKILKAFGIDSLASSVGVTPEELAIGSAVVVDGVAGPDRLLQVPWGWQPVSPVNLVVAAEVRAARRLLDCLVAPVEMLQKRLVQNMSVFRPGAIDLLTRGSEEGISDPRGWCGEAVAATLDLHARALLSNDEERISGLRQDLRHDPVLQRREAILHPRILLRERPGKDFRHLVTDCHLKHALLILDRMPMNRRAGRDETKQELERILSVSDHWSVSPDSRGMDRPATVRVILAMDTEERMQAAASGSFRGFLSLGGGRPPGVASKPGTSARFYAAYQDVLTLMEERRKSGEGPAIHFSSDDSCAAFFVQLQDYERECDEFRHNTGEAALALPVFLFHLFSLLRDTGEFGKFPDGELASAAFVISRRARKIHSDRVTADILRETIQEAARLAFEIVDRISETVGAGKPPKFRDIRRRFKRQKKERFEPVMSILVDLSVIVCDEECRFLPGDVSIEDVEGDLHQKLAETMSD
jgi:hypothetical protein